MLFERVQGMARNVLESINSERKKVWTRVSFSLWRVDPFDRTMDMNHMGAHNQGH